MTRGSPDRGITAGLDSDVLYLNLSSRNNEEGLTECVEVTPRFIVDLRRRTQAPVGIQVLEAAKQSEGIIDLESFKPVGQRVGNFGLVSPKQVLQLVDRLVSADKQAAENPTILSVKEVLQRRIDSR